MEGVTLATLEGEEPNRYVVVVLPKRIPSYYFHKGRRDWADLSFLYLGKGSKMAFAAIREFLKLHESNYQAPARQAC